jgi:hypothetical protein
MSLRISAPSHRLVSDVTHASAPSPGTDSPTGLLGVRRARRVGAVVGSAVVASIAFAAVAVMAAGPARPGPPGTYRPGDFVGGDGVVLGTTARGAISLAARAGAVLLGPGEHQAVAASVAASVAVLAHAPRLLGVSPCLALDPLAVDRAVGHRAGFDARRVGACVWSAAGGDRLVLAAGDDGLWQSLARIDNAPRHRITTRAVALGVGAYRLYAVHRVHLTVVLTVPSAHPSAAADALWSDGVERAAWTLERAQATLDGAGSNASVGPRSSRPRRSQPAGDRIG